MSLYIVFGRWAGFRYECQPRILRLVLGWFCIALVMADVDRLTWFALETLIRQKGKR